MIRLEEIYALIDSNFDSLLVTDRHERVIHVSPVLGGSVREQLRPLVGKQLAQILTPASLESFREAIPLARERSGSMVIFALQGHSARSMPLRTGCIETDDGCVYLFFGTQIDRLSRGADDDKDERVKELACLYNVAEWIDVATTIREFFGRLPDYLRPGMRYPQSAVVHSVYDGQEYGPEVVGNNFLRTRLIVNRQEAGVISVGYLDPELHLLPEEQRLLDEIGRMLSRALERREFSERLTMKQEEEADHRKHLRELEEAIEARTGELREQRANLERINSYLERVNRDWEESRTWLQTVLKGIPETVALIDRSRTLVMANKENVKIGGKCHQNLFGRDKPCKDCRLARIIREKTPITLTIEHENRHLEVHALPIFNDQHEVDGIMEFYRDVTLERTYEQQIRQADQLASLGQLVSGIGHEINNPNQFIRGNINILKQALDDMLPIVDAYQRDHPDLRIARLPYAFFRQHVMTLIDDMAHGSERIKGIVEGLRRFARRDEGLLIDTVEINTLIQECIRLVYKEVHKHAEIRTVLDPALPTLIGNSQKIEQVLVNLIVNAAQAMPDDQMGLIRVATKCVADQAVITVSDNGKGMNEKTLKQIFDPFFTTKRARGGTGLGLAIAYRIIEEHGGTIAVESEVGAGTTFTVRLPVRPEAPATAPADSQER